MARIFISHAALSNPQFTHDCDKCIYLGCQFDGSSIAMDFWLSENHELIIRRSSEPSVYSSFPVGIAVPLAKEKGPMSEWSQAVSRYDDHVSAGKGYYDLTFDQPGEPEYQTVVGMYEDIQVKETKKNLFIRDRHGNPLGIAKKDAFHIEKGQGEAFFFQPDMNIGGASISQLAPQLINTRKALYLYVMYLNQLSIDSGH